MIYFHSTGLVSVTQLPDLLGLIPAMLSRDDPRPAKEQFDEHYAHGGGWRPIEGWTLTWPGGSLFYSGDPPLRPLAQAQLHGELIIVYPHAWVCIKQADGSFEVARLD